MGYLVGVILIVGGVLALPGSGGISFLAIVVGLFAVTGQKINDKAVDAIEEAGKTGSKAEVISVGAAGCAGQLIFIIIGVAIIIGVFLFIFGASGMWSLNPGG